MLKVLIQVDTQDSSAVRTYLSQIGAQVYYNENPHFYDQNPIELIIKSQSKNNYIGSSTMVVLTLHFNQLKSCYIGGIFILIFRQWIHSYKSHQ